jgi:glc operon protein GlcG
MKFHAGLLAAAAMLALVRAAMAADGDQFVIQGDASRVLNEQHEINVATAEAIGQACVEEAVKQGVRVSVAVFDQFGELVYLYRMDGQGKIGIETAMMKAKTVLNTRLPSKRTMNEVYTGRSSELRQYSHGNFAQGGGLPIIISGQFIGAIGVGGSAGNLPVWSDEICAWRALTKVIGPQPALLPDIPPGGTTERVRNR